MQVVAIMIDVAIMRNVCSALHYPDSSRPSGRETHQGNLKNFVDVVLKREHSWTNTAIKCLVLFSSAKQEGSPLIPGEKTQAGLINQRMSLTGWPFPFFTKNTFTHAITRLTEFADGSSGDTMLSCESCVEKHSVK